MIKDSFANSILPFLAEDYEKLVVVDLRQLNVSGDRLLEMFSPTDILILYNSAQFAQDKEFEIKCNLVYRFVKKRLGGSIRYVFST